MDYRFFILGFVIALLGILAKKFPFLIAGYNTASKEEKKKNDIKRLSSLIMWSLIVLGTAIMIVPWIFNLLGKPETGETIIYILIPCVALFIIVKSRSCEHK